MAKIRTAVFPVAGRGTRFLPATKASPKEMLPIVDKPLIQYAVEEAIAAGAEKLVFITGSSKRAIEDHFDTDPELERQLAESGKHDLLALIRDIVPEHVTCIFVRQGVPLGLGHAVLCAQAAVGNEPFFVHLADDLIYSDVPCLQQMAQHYETARRKRARRRDRAARPDRQLRHRGRRDREIGRAARQENRRKAEARRCAVEPGGRGPLHSYAGNLREATSARSAGPGGEIQLTDGIAALLADEPVHVLPFTGIRYDCGSKIGYLRATVEYGLRHPELGDSFRAYLQSVWER